MTDAPLAAAALRVLGVEQVGAPILRRPAAPVTAVDHELQALVERMFHVMYAVAGEGLAAPQIGLSLRLAVVDVPPRGPPYVLVNPRIAWACDDQTRAPEGCLSIPGEWAMVERPAAVVVEAQGLDGQFHMILADGELARCLQHQIDHLDGVLYIDRIALSRRSLAPAWHRKHGRSGGPFVAKEVTHDRRRAH